MSTIRYGADSIAATMGETTQERAAVDVLLAEYNALRSEIVSHVTVQAAVVGLGLTALGVIVGLAANSAADHRILLLVPPLGLFVVLIYSAETYRSAAIEIFIYRRIWPRLEKVVGELPSWERQAGLERKLGLGSVGISALIDLPAMAVFVLAGIGSLIEVWDQKDGYWWAGVGFVLVSVAAIGLVA
jgi:hypothetical protein